MNNKRNRYTSRYNLGGKKMYQAGGMYGNNQIPPGLGSTAMTVYQESDPRIQEQREARFASEVEEQQRKGDALSEELAVTAEQNKVKVQQAFETTAAKFDTGMAMAQKGVEGYSKIKKVMDAKKAADALKAAKAAEALKATQTVASGTKGAVGALGAVPVGIAAPTASTAAVTTGATYGAGLIGPAAAPVATGAATGAATTLGTTAAKGAVGGAGVGTGLAKFASSGAGIGTIATLAGAGITALSDDDDPTKSNVGEYTGSVLSSAGTGASVGSFFGPVGTAVGAGVGAIYGAGKQYFGTKKAKKEKKKLEEEWAKKVTKRNKELSESVASQRSAVRAGNIRQKTYSGYDLGQNVVAQMGGMRMGIPKYGYAA